MGVKIRTATLRIAFSGIVGFFLFYPLVFCPFGLPYIYCFVCPRRRYCGNFRGIILLAILALNFRKRFYCSWLCPAGTIQDFVYAASTKKLVLPAWTYAIKYFILGLAVLAVALSGRILLFIETRWILYFAGLVLLLSLFIRRFWCRVLCPVGALTGIFSRK